LLANDGRNHLVLTPEETYDLIVSEPSNPWITGVSNLFTKEFWEMGKKRLKPGGVWSQWVQMYGMDDADLKSLLGTFASVYPHMLVYATIEDADLVLVGSDAPLAPSIQNAQRLFEWSPELTEELNELAINEPLDIVAMFQLDRPGVQRLAEGAVFNTDDNMRIEYRAPKHLHIETAWNNMKLMMKHTSIPLEFLEPDAVLFADLARVYQERQDVRRAWWTMDRAVRMLPSGDPMRMEWAKEAVGWREELTEDEPEELD
jgi:spermidine synthase